MGWPVWRRWFPTSVPGYAGRTPAAVCRLVAEPARRRFRLRWTSLECSAHGERSLGRGQGLWPEWLDQTAATQRKTWAVSHSWWLRLLADRTNGHAIATLLRLSVRRLSMTLCIVAKRCVLEQKLLWRAYRKSYMRNRLERNISKTTWARDFKFGVSLCIGSAELAHK